MRVESVRSFDMTSDPPTARITTTLNVIRKPGTTKQSLGQRAKALPGVDGLGLDARPPGEVLVLRARRLDVVDHVDAQVRVATQPHEGLLQLLVGGRPGTGDPEQGQEVEHGHADGDGSQDGIEDHHDDGEQRHGDETDGRRRQLLGQQEGDVVVELHSRDESTGRARVEEADRQPEHVPQKRGRRLDRQPHPQAEQDALLEEAQAELQRPTRAASATTVAAQFSFPSVSTWSTKIAVSPAATVVGTTSATPATVA